MEAVMAGTNYAFRANMPIGAAVQANVTATATSTASALSLTAVRYWVISDVDCYIKFGTTASLTAPTTANSMWIPASTPHLFDRGPTATVRAKVLRKGSTSGKIACIPVA